ncbi:hypothetical protein [Microbulbifer variabilis]|uniref:hypothetical protein n=1 Tax=Microbulbifer variabilis TaxID=266805 RepID=UPI001CFF29B4|nr:hypothetical protein [Microbulbifer variabilis]
MTPLIQDHYVREGDATRAFCKPGAITEGKLTNKHLHRVKLKLTPLSHYIFACPSHLKCKILSTASINLPKITDLASIKNYNLESTLNENRGNTKMQHFAEE